MLPADKGCSVVVLVKDLYEKKVLNLLSGSRAYQVLAKDPAPSLELRMNKLLMDLKRVGVLPDKFYCLWSSAGKTPLFYGLPKIHKAWHSSEAYCFIRQLTFIWTFSDATPLVGSSASHTKNPIGIAFLSRL